MCEGVRSFHSTPRRESRPQGEGNDGTVKLVKETWAGGERLEKTMQTSMRGISNRAAKDKGHRLAGAFCLMLVSANVSSFEEPGAVVPHAGICEGAVG